MSQKDNTVFSVLKRALIFILIILGLMFFGLREWKPYVLGFVFGSSISILCFLLLNNTIKKSVLMEPSKAYNYTLGNYMLRYFIYFAVLVISAIAEYLSFGTTILGLFLIKIVILSNVIYDTIKRGLKNLFNKNSPFK